MQSLVGTERDSHFRGQIFGQMRLIDCSPPNPMTAPRMQVEYTAELKPNPPFVQTVLMSPGPFLVRALSRKVAGPG